MKLFLKKLALLLLICMLFAAAANLAFFLVKGSLTPAYVERFLHAPARIQVANLGNSHGQNGFSYANHPEIGAVNLAFGSQSLAQDERVLGNYIDRFNEGAVLYIPVSYSSLLSSSSGGNNFLSLNRRYYYFLRRDLVIDFSWREWLAVKSPGLFIPNWQAQYWTVDEFDEAGERSAADIDVAKDAEAAVERHVLSHQNDHYQMNEQSVGCLKRIVLLCKEHRITPVLVTTPFLREYNDLVPGDFLEKQQSFLYGFAAEQQIEYLDFSRDSRFADRYDLFLNSDHLNDKGALVFTDLLLAGERPVF